MLQHIVLFQFSEAASTNDRRRIQQQFMELKGKIDGVVELVSGPNVSPEGLGQGYDLGFLVTFHHPTDRDTYLVHPAHESFVAELEGIVERALVFDLDLSEGN